LTRRRIGILTGCRSDYGLLRPFIRRVAEEPKAELVLYAAAGHLSPSRGMTVEEIRRDGFEPLTLAPVAEEEDTPTGMAELASRVTDELARLWLRDRPDWLVVLGDRVEVLGAAVAAWYCRVPLAQFHAGDLSLVDDGPRHAVSRLAHLLFPATRAAAQRLCKWGEEGWRVHRVGSLAADRALSGRALGPEELRTLGERVGLDLDGDFLVLVYHPLPGEPEKTAKGLAACLEALDAASLPVLALHPNADAGGKAIVAELERWVGRGPHRSLRVSLAPEPFAEILRRTRALVGNSSAGLIECSVMGTPAVNVGPRQGDRERGANVFDTNADPGEVRAALAKILAEAGVRERFLRRPSPYGDGGTAARALGILLETPIDDTLLDKTLRG
jgi:GDP/UDP-N,N'-diacetylbacillosamine 2-epimerase (hydrolysing)